VTTPPECPPRGHWSSRAQFAFADGTTTTVADSTPCEVVARPRLRLRLSGRRARAGRRPCFVHRIRATVTGRDRRKARRAEFFVGRRRVGRDVRPPLSQVADRERHRGRSHTHVMRARVRMADGQLTGLRRRYRVCADRR